MRRARPPALLLVWSRLVGLLALATILNFLSAPFAESLARDGFPELRGYVNDYVDVLPPREESRLEAFLERVDQEYGIQLAIAILPDVEEYGPAEYANRLYETWGVGDAETDRGLLILDARAERHVRVEVGYGLEGALPDARTGDIVRSVLVPLLAAGRSDAYAQGALALLAPAVQEVGGDPSELTSLFENSGYRTYSPRTRGKGEEDTWEFLLLLVLVLIVLVILTRNRGGRSRGRGSTIFWTGGGFGGFGGGSSGGGGFGGFGGGMSGGGGAGSGY